MSFRFIRKLILQLFIVIGILVGGMLCTYAEGNNGSDFVDLKFWINEGRYISSGGEKVLDVPPQILNSRTVVPFRTIFEELGYTLSWEDLTKKLTAIKDGVTMELWINKATATINGKEIALTVAPQIIGGRTFVPLRFISENSGAYIEWNDEEKSALVLKLNNIPSNALYSPSGKNLLIQRPDTAFYIFDTNSNILKKLGKFSQVTWLSEDELYTEGEKKQILKLDGSTINLSMECKYVGKTNKNEYIFSNGGKIYTVLNGVSKEIKDFGFNIEHLMAVSLNGPFVIASSEKDEIQFYKTLDSLPVVIGKASALINKNGDVGSQLLDTEVFFSPEGNRITFLQFEASKTNVFVFDVENPSDTKKVSISYPGSTESSKKKIDIKWDGNDRIKIYSSLLNWNIVIGSTLEVTEEINSMNALNFGTALIYTKESEESRNFFVTNGKTSKVISMPHKETKNWYSFKGKVFATILDSLENKLSFVMFNGDGFEVILDDFSIEETFEYNDNLLIHGYDRKQKVNKLLRFDGNGLETVAEDFYVGKHVEFKGKLVINKYDKFRHYTLLTFDKASENPWEPSVLSEGFIVEDYLVGEEQLYFLGSLEKGGAKPLVSYDGSSSKITTYLTNNNMFKVEDLMEFDAKLYGISNQRLYYLGEKSEIETDLISLNDPLRLSLNGVKGDSIDNAYKIGFTGDYGTVYVPRDDGSGIDSLEESSEILKAKSKVIIEINQEIANQEMNLNSLKESELKDSGTLAAISTAQQRVDTLTNKRLALDSLSLLPRVTKFSVFKDKIYVGLSSRDLVYAYEVHEEDKTLWKEEILVSFKTNQLITVEKEFNAIKVANERFNWLDYTKTKEYLYLLGEDDGADKDKMMYICGGSEDFIPVRDVSKINKMQGVGNRVFLDIHDYDRIAKAERDSVIVFDGTLIKNVVLGHTTTKWDEVNGVFILSLKEADLETQKISSYDDIFNSIVVNFDTSFWKKIENTLFVSGKSKDEKFSFMKFEGAEKVEISSDVKVKDVIKLKEGYFLVFGTDMKVTSPTKDQQVLYLYNASNNSLTVMKAGVEILNMILL